MQYGFILAALGLFSAASAVPAVDLKSKDYYGSCDFSLKTLLTAPYGSCLIHTPGESGKDRFFCTKASQCQNEGDDCHIHCVPSPYGGGDCTAKCAPGQQHPGN